jgi:hypothetical protein
MKEKIEKLVEAIAKVVTESDNLAEITKEVEKIFNNEKVESGRWKPEQNKKYFCIESDGMIGYYVWRDNFTDFWRFSQRNCFKTEKEAEKFQRFLEIKAKIMDIAEKLGRATVEDWKNDSIKFFLFFDHNRKKIVQNVNLAWNEKNIYCLSENFIKVCLERIGEHDLKFYLISDFI